MTPVLSVVSSRSTRRRFRAPSGQAERVSDVPGRFLFPNGIVVRNGFGRDMADLLLDDLRSATEFLEALPAPLPTDPSHTENFHH